MTEEKVQKLLTHGAPLVFLAIVCIFFGGSTIIDPSYFSYRFGYIRFGEYGYVVGAVFLVFGLYALFGAVKNIRKVLKDEL